MFTDILEKYDNFCSDYIDKEISRLETKRTNNAIQHYNNVLSSYRGTSEALMEYMLNSCRYNEHGKALQDKLRSAMDTHLASYRKFLDF